MKAQFRILQNMQVPPEKSAIHIGSLVINPLFPHQSYFDPSHAPTEASVPAESHSNPRAPSESVGGPVVHEAELTNFEGFLSNLRAGKLENILMKLASLSFAVGSLKLDKLSTVEVKEYQLDNSDAWFMRICKMQSTREWMERGLRKGYHLYLVTGYRTLLSARLSQGKVSAAAASVGGQDSSQSIKAEARYQSEDTKSEAFSAPRERVFAVQYRQVQFSFSSSKNIDNADLEFDNRWKQIARLRGDNTSDIIEANLSEVASWDSQATSRQDADGGTEYVYDETEVAA